VLALIRGMEQPTDSGPGSSLTHLRNSLELEAQRLRMLLDKLTQSTPAPSDDVVRFRLAADRRRSATNILPYRQRRATDQGH